MRANHFFYYFFSVVAVLSLGLLLIVNLDAITGLATATATVQIEIVPAQVCGNSVLETGEGCENDNHCSADSACFSCTCLVVLGGGSGSEGGGGGGDGESSSTPSEPVPAEEPSDTGDEPPPTEIEHLVIEITHQDYEEQLTQDTETIEEIFTSLELDVEQGWVGVETAEGVVVEKEGTQYTDIETNEPLPKTRFTLNVRNDTDKIVEDLIIIDRLPVIDVQILSTAPFTPPQDAVGWLQTMLQITPISAFLAEETPGYLTRIDSTHRFGVLSDEFIVFKIPILMPGETVDISYTIPIQLSEKELSQVTAPVVMAEKLVEVDSCQDMTCEDNNPCTQDACSVGSCVHAAVQDGTVCGEGLACFQGHCTAPVATMLSSRGVEGMSQEDLQNGVLVGTFLFSAPLAYIFRRRLRRYARYAEEEEEALVDVILEKKLRRRRAKVKEVKKRLLEKWDERTPKRRGGAA